MLGVALTDFSKNKNKKSLLHIYIVGGALALGLVASLAAQKVSLLTFQEHLSLYIVFKTPPPL